MKKSHKNVLITGSSRGIGLEIAKCLSCDYNVYITARNKDTLKKLCTENGFAGYAAADLFETEGADGIIQKLNVDIDVLINNAGVYYYSQVDKFTEKELLNTVNLNILSTIRLTKSVVPHMKQANWGRIINIGSISGVMGEANASLYSMSKAALIGFTKAAALELAQNNITVNIINPGWVDTELTNNENLLEDFSKEEILETVPQRRFVLPEEIAETCKFLLSDKARTITGQSINICAGLSLGC